MKRIGVGISAEERALFREHIHGHQLHSYQSHTVRDSAMLGTEKKPLKKSTMGANGVIAPQDSRIILDKIFPDAWQSAAACIRFAANGVSPRQQTILKRGQCSIDDRLDLHGMTGNHALEQSVLFLARAQQAGARCVLIIHGKGNDTTYPGPILKNLLHQWLPTQPAVLAYHSARPADGGTGALYVLLKSATS